MYVCLFVVYKQRGRVVKRDMTLEVFCLTFGGHVILVTFFFVYSLTVTVHGPSKAPSDPDRRHGSGDRGP